MAVIEVQDLVVRYGARTAVAGVSFEAHASRVLGLLGPNGAGKTTTVETLEGYRQPAAGRVAVLGMDPVADRRALAPRIGVMLQQGGVYARMSPRQALRLFAGYYREPEDPESLLERLALVDAARTPWRHLSGGERQRLSLALALVGKPTVAFLDEPTAGVDPAGRLAIRQVVRDLADGGACVVLTTHELDEAQHLADNLVIVDQGRVIAQGSPSELMAGVGGGSIRFGAPPHLDVASLSATLGAAVVEDSPGEYTVSTSPTPQAVATLTSWLAQRSLPLADLRAGRGTLEDVFLQLTGTPGTGQAGGAAVQGGRSRGRRSAGHRSERSEGAGRRRTGSRR
ncbi:MAG: ABC transporter ATP-binding protein [Actinomycetota bacterium]|nr:ABC transporter ATP-binding protein [Actinomycetota bacterium]